MTLPFGQVELVREVTAANPRTVVVLIASAPYDLREIESAASTLVWGWFNGSESGSALADMLFGDVNPSAKLPFTMPVCLEDSPAHALNAYPGQNSTVTYEEGILVGYRWFDTKNIEPLYCFGHGLSYSDFSYSSFKTDRSVYAVYDTILISCKVKNNGRRSGAEVVQVYMHEPEPPVLRPAKELKGFEKVFLKPGQEKRVNITIPVCDLAFFNDQTMEWVVDPGQFQLLIGSSSRDIRGDLTIHVK